MDATYIEIYFRQKNSFAFKTFGKKLKVFGTKMLCRVPKGKGQQAAGLPNNREYGNPLWEVPSRLSDSISIVNASVVFHLAESERSVKNVWSLFNHEPVTGSLTSGLWNLDTWNAYAAF
ncbi:hypothetical protein CAPTEDRAFT_197560 [Capitella teleta]|uniref:Uncharacterized protein n=1 Tax=Capitella teleta TaxID=283909 RepID=R7U2Y9_CAPTE|nr:hypothetical protein CAPTEDRAFT_197560 [Capitella teleta]|eukprot:ELT98036.1 hypothetical protein CAPTEDRAFT_197560 [Capitella teleta]